MTVKKTQLCAERSFLRQRPSQGCTDRSVKEISNSVAKFGLWSLHKSCRAYAEVVTGGTSTVK